MAFDDSTNLAIGHPVRRFESFVAASDEAAISRLYGGIHYPWRSRTGRPRAAASGATSSSACTPDARDEAGLPGARGGGMPPRRLRRPGRDRRASGMTTTASAGAPSRLAGRGQPGFTSLPGAQTGITFVNSVRDSLVLANRILVQGGGVALGDYDGDGRVDVYLCRTDGANALYRNLGGMRFEDVTASAGVAVADRYSTGATFADFDGDGDLDLLVLALGGPNAWFVNDGQGHFTEQALPDRAGSTTGALADVDGDGDLDLVIANYKAYTTLDSLPPQMRAFDQLARQTGPRPVRDQPAVRARLPGRPPRGPPRREHRAARRSGLLLPQ